MSLYLALVLLVICAFLWIALRQMLHANHKGLNQALFYRVIISIALVIFIIIAYYTGLLKPGKTLVYL